MKALISAVVVGAIALGYQQAPSSTEMEAGAATTYEHLATAIIEIRATENNLVKGILMHHFAKAMDDLEAAGTAPGGERGKLLESAATQVGYIANEGGPRVQAVRQRLLKAGHHHNTDEQTKDDYMFIDSKEKQQLLALATRLPQMPAGSDMSSLVSELKKVFRMVLAAE